MWVLSTSRPVLFGNYISECGDHGVAFVSTADDMRENQKLSAQFLQQDQEQVKITLPELRNLSYKLSLVNSRATLVLV